MKYNPGAWHLLVGRHHLCLFFEAALQQVRVEILAHQPPTDLLLRVWTLAQGWGSILLR